MSDIERIQASRAKRSLRDFIRQAWHVLEPDTTYKHNWHIDAIADHLEAVSRGDIKKLIINVPPGHMKSLSVCVFWPAWDWISFPHLRWLFASYASQLSSRDSIKTRTLINSDWYRARWGERFGLTKWTEDLIHNDRQGFRMASSTGGVGTGERVHRVVNDDLLRANDARSDAMRKQAIEHMQAMSTRAVDPKAFSQVLIMQRLHEQDPAGWAMEQGDWEHLMLPAEFEPDRRCKTSIGFKDPRKKAGELLWPGQFGRQEIDDIRTALGDQKAAAQLQQRPSPGEGDVFKPGKIEIVDVLPIIPARWARGWDLGSTTDGDYTVGLLLGKLEDGRYIIADVVRFRKGPDERDGIMRLTGKMDGPGVRQDFPQDPGQAGKSQVIHLTRVFDGSPSQSSPESGDKITRAELIASHVNAGNVLMLRGPWNKALTDELGVFPNGTYDDQVDALSRAYAALLKASVNFGGM